MLAIAYGEREREHEKELFLSDPGERNTTSRISPKISSHLHLPGRAQMHRAHAENMSACCI